MSEDALRIIKDSLAEIGINYEFGEWSGELAYPYFVGEYQETAPLNEDGMNEATFILTGYSRGSRLDLEEAKNKIKKQFNSISGKIVNADNAVAIFYSNSIMVDSIDAELRQIQINLLVKEWSI